MATRRKRSRTRHQVRVHPYTPSTVLPADHNGLVPCICGRAKPNAAHDPEQVAAQAAEREAAQTEQLRRLGEDSDQ
ncbi:hypothetical protein EYA84_02195 [Verrucosispora sp. SN26_14.1]|uniref:hypothetical protein n=1 Tax=Verrucosispora sp. SN26_14.1 TaxID=2527879 RepID=UPI0010351572|nr:hypothetical protein [Verrucosispora sp. SN26_14.1]TBL44275.1 hypothetical protein EYA84_02195 [Verrucosispora sp. SN26_14.1]